MYSAVTRRWTPLCLVALALVAFVTLASAQLSSPRVLAPRTALNVQALRLGVDRVLQAQGLSESTRRQLGANFSALPPEAQKTIAALLDPKVAQQVGRPELSVRPGRLSAVVRQVDPRVIEVLVTPLLSSFLPEGGGSRDQLCVAVGANFNSTCQVLLDGVAAPHTYYWSSTMVLFRIPAAATLGHVYAVKVRRQDSGKESATQNLKVVAPRGWRGVHGLSFANFSAAAIPWSVYREVFGPGNVEFANGTHRPSAQAWYDSTYKSIGNNGNCFGMSQLSLRTRRFLFDGDTHALDRVVHGSWVASNVTWGGWTLPWTNDSKEAVQSLQGLQLVDPMASYITTQKTSQDNKTAWTFADNSLSSAQPVQNTLYGHAVVTYDTTIDGDNRYFEFYDNNNPYSESETGASNPNRGRTVWSTGSFSYGGYTKTRCYNLTSLMGQPQLPAGVGGSGDSAADSATVRFEVPRVAGLRITDEAGRGGPDGVGVPGLGELEPEMGLGPVPDNFPRIFLLRQAAGRQLNFTVPNAAGQPRQLACYAPGVVLLLDCRGAQIAASFSQLTGRNAQVALANPTAAGLERLRFLAPIGASEERSFLLTTFTGLSASPVGMSLSPDRGAVEVLNAAGAPAVQFGLQLERLLNGALNSLPVTPQTAPAGQLHRVGPQNWGALQGGALRVDRLALPVNRLRPR